MALASARSEVERGLWSHEGCLTSIPGMGPGTTSSHSRQWGECLGRVDRKKTSGPRVLAVAGSLAGWGCGALSWAVSSSPRREEVCVGTGGAAETSLLCSHEEKGLFWG